MISAFLDILVIEYRERHFPCTSYSNSFNQIWCLYEPSQLFLLVNSAISLSQRRCLNLPTHPLHFANSSASFRLYAFPMYGRNKAS